MNNELIGNISKLLGVLLLSKAFFMDTTVNTGMGRVHNLGLLAKQNNLYLLGALFLIAGIFIHILTKKDPEKNLTKAETEEDLKADRESDELEKQRAADEALYVQSGEKFLLSNFDYALAVILFILAMLFSIISWWIVGFFILLLGLFLNHKEQIFKKKIIAEMKAISIQPEEISKDL